MKIKFTDEELKMLRFAVQLDLETVNKALEQEGTAENWQYDKRVLESILSKLPEDDDWPTDWETVGGEDD